MPFSTAPEMGAAAHEPGYLLKGQFSWETFWAKPERVPGGSADHDQMVRLDICTNVNWGEGSTGRQKLLGP